MGICGQTIITLSQQVNKIKSYFSLFCLMELEQVVSCCKRMHDKYQKVSQVTYIGNYKTGGKLV